ncbi:hypothetical protein WR25_05378 [Diploscapter pachys]|uniref:Uncharacterized protein n=1 Tax=Diploscapter pachys TaxID=2018661 RepID=A0A2A2K9Y9_9BILA|nr:hypothetical protein WR25_05378 [Diploscapter pachys]
MVAQLISGNEISKEVNERVSQQIKSARETHPNFEAALAIVQVGDRSDSTVYINAKIKRASDVGVNSKLHKLPSTITQEELEKKIDELNDDDEVDGILVQLPLDCVNPVDTDAIIDRIKHDVDGLTRENAGRLLRGELSNTIFPCTPYGCLHLVQRATGDPHFVAGKHVVVLGRSKIVGAPAAQLFLWHHATVTVCHSKTQKIEEHCDWIKPGAVVIDCGINVEPIEQADGTTKNKLYGDVDFEAAKQVASFITPVPGGVGPMTVAMLIQNTVYQAIRRRIGHHHKHNQNSN